MNLSIEQLLLYHHYIKKIDKVEDLQLIFQSKQKYNYTSTIKRFKFNDKLLNLTPKVYSSKNDTALFLDYEEFIYDNHSVYSHDDMLISSNLTISLSNICNSINSNLKTIPILLKACYLIRHGWFIHEEHGVRFYILSPDTSEEFYIDSSNPTCSCHQLNCFHSSLFKIYRKFKPDLDFLVIR